jgi:hypothetical protein
VEFGDPRLARSAASIVLHGSIEGLTPVAAVETVLPACGLVHRVRGGALFIEELPHRGP